MTGKQKYDGQKTTYKQFIRQQMGKSAVLKNTTVRPTVTAIMSYLDRIAIGEVEWDGIDGNGIAQSSKVEEYLYYLKRCAIVETNEVGLAVVKLLPLGVNIYGEPAGYDIVTNNGVKLTPALPRIQFGDIKPVGQIGNDNAIILHDSQLHYFGRIDGVWHWVEKFADAQISLEQQLTNQRAPLIGYTKSRNEEGTARVEIIDVKSGINALVLDESMKDSIRPLNLEGQFNVDRINAIQHEYLSRALNSLGVDSTQAFGKKERMVVDEVESNDESLAMILSDMLMARRKALIDNPTAKKYGIECRLAKPYRISTYKENHIDYAMVENEDPTADNNKDDGDLND